MTPCTGLVGAAADASRLSRAAGPLARPREPRASAAVVIEASTGTTRTAASVRSAVAEQAEEVAIALAIADADCHTVLSDSRQAVRKFTKGQICRETKPVLRAVKLQDRKVRIKWFPAHAGDASERNDNHNETAHAAARALMPASH
ncbi:hypothetical protein HPB47_005241 [Ixodes persulcatus]|uniref:Uncharacterized protein n=1 Tax=Ixodes persulcatus TaxID=34615 RepID=A0AC60PEE8_IXOPE|nr:hypothetical protein HPB47_005241 [Ixodes persulcatus]